MTKITKIEGYSESIQNANNFHRPLILNVSSYFYRSNNNHDWSANFVSNSCVDVTECTKEQIQSHRMLFGKLIYKPDRDMVWETVQLALRKRCPYQLLYKIITPSGKDKITFEQGEGIFDDTGKCIEIAGYILDVSDLYLSINTNLVSTLQTCINEVDALPKNNPQYRQAQFQTLSLRETETLARLCQGKTMKEIAIDMDISPRTIEMHIRRAKSKLSCRTQAELRKILFMTSSGKKLIVDL